MGRTTSALNESRWAASHPAILLRLSLGIGALACLVVPSAMAQSRVRPVAERAYTVLAGAFGALRTRDYDAAISGFVRVLELTPSRNDVRKNLAYTYFKVGKNELARRQFEEVVRRDSSDETAALELAFLDFDSPQTGKKAEAYSLFNRLRSARNTSIRSRATITFSSVDTALGTRMAQWSDAMRKEPQNDFFSIQYARAAEERGRPKLAEEFYRGSLSSGFPTLWLDLARVLRVQGRIREAEEASQRAATTTNAFVAEEAREEAVARRGDVARPGPPPPPPPSPRAPASGYAVVGEANGSWPAVLGAGGFMRADRREARLIVLRSDSAQAATDWEAAVRNGTFLILEGVSPVAEALGFKAI